MTALEDTRNEDPETKAPDDKSANNGDNAASQVTPPATPPHPPPTPPSNCPPKEEPTKWRENLKLMFEILGLGVLIAYTVFSALQWAQIRWTNRMTKEALDGSNTSLQQTLNKMQGQIEETHRLYGEAKKQADQIGRLATDTETANTNIVNSDRPWMGSYLTVGSFAAGETPSFTITFVNSGKSPARVIIGAIHGDIYTKFPPNPDGYYSTDIPSTRAISVMM
jgi:hypothetical protein